MATAGAAAPGAPSTTYVMYRNTTLGEALQKTLEDLVSDQLIPESLVPKVLAIYDKAINKALSTRAKNKVTFRSDKAARVSKLRQRLDLHPGRRRLPRDRRGKGEPCEVCRV
ncbi:unnamed protein product [Caenorhabditis auriculariae]|uniref:Transcription initiation factor IIA gamma subunit N-terminal domain-containing protein n=1 Tax=Caenorhabditis auriculariae TaxID=2777116 RepID=A0A8S1I0F9_9PELO|nr:unnamed protein product [Caenorhabditis auriculariae]